MILKEKVHQDNMFSVVEQTINTELVNELRTIQLFDQLRSAIKDIVDLPNPYLELMLKLLHQGLGVLSKNKRRKSFSMLSDQEILEIEAAYQEIILTIDTDCITKEKETLSFAP